ncbi:MAG: GspE/PulE family protein [Tepidisphaerales bacterium]
MKAAATPASAQPVPLNADAAPAVAASDAPAPAAALAPYAAPLSVGPRPAKRFGESLVQKGALSEQQLSRALAEQKATGARLGEMLVAQGVISQQTMVEALSETLGVPGVVLRHGLLDPAVFPLLGEEEATRLCAVPMFRVRDTLTVALSEPQSLPKIDRLRLVTGCRIRPVLALEANIREYIAKYRGGDVNVDSFLTTLSEAEVDVVDREAVDEGPVTDLDKLVAGSPIVNLVNVMLLTAVRDGASDIHIEPEKKTCRIRYRIDGVLRDLMRPPAGMHAAIVSRVKVIGKMDIAEKRLPQEGRIRIIAEGREIDVRVSSMPTLLGEKLVCRILDKQNLRVKLEDLGMRLESLTRFRRMLERPHGLLLVTGPTGSGKTTTLYSALDLLRNPEVNIMTVEDPVEYQLELVNQIQVQSSIGLTFARALRSILRQDPDIIMIGEIRDEETARVAVQAALTGHLVLATLHTNDAAGAVTRLIDMGVEPYLLSSALVGVIAQRLTRTVCPDCAVNYFPSPAELEEAGLPTRSPRPMRKGEGCRKCHDTGFRGRVGIYEVMEVTPALRRLIARNRPVHELREHLRNRGIQTLREEGVLMAVAGRTTLEEVLRVTHNDEDAAADAPPADNAMPTGSAASADGEPAAAPPSSSSNGPGAATEAA